MIKIIQIILFLFISIHIVLAQESTSEDSTEVIEVNRKSELDQKVIYSAKDSVIFKPGKSKLRLKGNSKVDYGEDKLSAEIIIFDIGNSSLDALAGQDSSGNYFGFPKYNQSGSDYYAKQLSFNFKTKKGVISFGETEISEGFYFGKKIKRISDTELFVQDGFYTTCDAPKPHYYFGSPEMKVISEDRVLIDPLIFYVEDVPVFIYPFGIFFPTKSGRQSGVIVPSFAVSQGRGVIFENMGFYWATSDYFDTQFTTNLYSKGGYLLRNFSRWNVKGEYSGDASVQYGRTRFNTDDEYVTAWKFTLNHRQSFTPYQNFNANLNFSSSDFNRNTSGNINDRVQQNITSNASYNLNFDNGSSFSIGYNRDQNIIDETYTQSLPVSYTLPNLSLFEIGGKEFVFRNTSRLNYTQQKNRDIETNAGITDTNFTNEERKYISHSPSLSFNLPRLYYFNITPSLNFGMNNYFRKLDRTYNEETGEFEDSFERGFFTEYFYNYGFDLQTRLYGIANFGSEGLKAFRHTFEPTISYRINPDFSGEQYDFYDTYYDPVLEREVQYNRFSEDGGSHASANESQNIGINIQNRFEAKVGDDTTDTNLEILQLNLRTNYNLSADSLNFSDVNMTFRTPAIGFINFTGNAGFTLYDEVRIRNEDGNIVRYEKINEFLINSDKGIARLTNLSLSLSTSFDSEGISLAKGLGSENEDLDSTESVGIGDRFSRRINYNENERNLYGENNPGYQKIGIPWSVNLGLNFRYGRPNLDRITRSLSLNANFRFQLTETWKFDANGIYDLIEQELKNTSINITKDMHCWDLSFRWYPIGINRGFYLRFGIKASQLRDLQLEKRDDPVFR